LPLPLSELFIAGCCRSNPSTYFHQVYDDNRWWISRYQTLEWIFLCDEITLPEIWKSEFRYSEIAYFVLDDLSISVWILVKTLPHLRCVAVFTNVSTEIMIRYAQKRI